LQTCCPKRHPRLQQQLYQAFDLRLLYNNEMHQVTICATITAAAPSLSPLSSTTATARTP
jgi:hypothetical protein